MKEELEKLGFEYIKEYREEGYIYYTYNSNNILVNIKEKYFMERTSMIIIKNIYSITTTKK